MSQCALVLDVDFIVPIEFNTLSEESKSFIKAELRDFVYNATQKFIEGQKEHGGNLWDRDCLKEMEQETIDLFWYGAAEKKKRNKNG